MPVEWMLAVLRDPEADQSRRDRMAEIAAPYLHPQLIHTYQELSETEPWQEVEHVPAPGARRQAMRRIDTSRSLLIPTA